MSRVGHNYTQRIDAAHRLVYEKVHKNGDATEIVAERVNENDENGENWEIFAYDYDGDDQPIADESLGWASHKNNAENVIDGWARAHPKGVDPPPENAVEKLREFFGGD